MRERNRERERVREKKGISRMYYMNSWGCLTWVDCRSNTLLFSFIATTAPIAPSRCPHFPAAQHQEWKCSLQIPTFHFRTPFVSSHLLSPVLHTPSFFPPLSSFTISVLSSPSQLGGLGRVRISSPKKNEPLYRPQNQRFVVWEPPTPNHLFSFCWQEPASYLGQRDAHPWQPLPSHSVFVLTFLRRGDVNQWSYPWQHGWIPACRDHIWFYLPVDL